MPRKPEDNLKPGDLVFAKMRGFPYWPARVCKSESGYKKRVPVFFFGTHQIGHLPPHNIVPYVGNKMKYGGGTFFKGFAEGMWEIQNTPGVGSKLRVPAKSKSAAKPAPAPKTPTRAPSVPRGAKRDQVLPEAARSAQAPPPPAGGGGAEDAARPAVRASRRSRGCAEASDAPTLKDHAPKKTRSRRTTIQAQNQTVAEDKGPENRKALVTSALTPAPEAAGGDQAPEETPDLSPDPRPHLERVDMSSAPQEVKGPSTARSQVDAEAQKKKVSTAEDNSPDWRKLKTKETPKRETEEKMGRAVKRRRGEEDKEEEVQKRESQSGAEALQRHKKTLKKMKKVGGQEDVEAAAGGGMKTRRAEKGKEKKETETRRETRSGKKEREELLGQDGHAGEEVHTREDSTRTRAKREEDKPGANQGKRQQKKRMSTEHRGEAGEGRKEEEETRSTEEEEEMETEEEQGEEHTEDQERQHHLAAKRESVLRSLQGLLKAGGGGGRKMEEVKSPLKPAEGTQKTFELKKMSQKSDIRIFIRKLREDGSGTEEDRRDSAGRKETGGKGSAQSPREEESCSKGEEGRREETGKGQDQEKKNERKIIGKIVKAGQGARVQVKMIGGAAVSEEEWKKSRDGGRAEEKKERKGEKSTEPERKSERTTGRKDREEKEEVKKGSREKKQDSGKERSGRATLTEEKSGKSGRGQKDEDERRVKTEEEKKRDKQKDEEVEQRSRRRRDASEEKDKERGHEEEKVTTERKTRGRARDEREEEREEEDSAGGAMETRSDGRKGARKTDTGRRSGRGRQKEEGRREEDREEANGKKSQNKEDQRDQEETPEDEDKKTETTETRVSRGEGEEPGQKKKASKKRAGGDEAKEEKDGRQRKSEEATPTDSTLHRIHGDIRISLKTDKPDIEKCLTALDQLSLVYVTSKHVQRHSELVVTLRKLRSYRASRSVMEKAAMLYNRFKHAYLLGEGQELVSASFLRSLLEEKEKEEEQRAERHQERLQAEEGADGGAGQRRSPEEEESGRPPALADCC